MVYFFEREEVPVNNIDTNENDVNVNESVDYKSKVMSYLDPVLNFSKKLLTNTLEVAKRIIKLPVVLVSVAISVVIFALNFVGAAFQLAAGILEYADDRMLRKPLLPRSVHPYFDNYEDGYYNVLADIIKGPFRQFKGMVKGLNDAVFAPLPEDLGLFAKVNPKTPRDQESCTNKVLAIPSRMAAGVWSKMPSPLSWYYGKDESVDCHLLQPNASSNKAKLR